MPESNPPRSERTTKPASPQSKRGRDVQLPRNPPPSLPPEAEALQDVGTALGCVMAALERLERKLGAQSERAQAELLPEVRAAREVARVVMRLVAGLRSEEWEQDVLVVEQALDSARTLVGPLLGAGTTLELASRGRSQVRVGEVTVLRVMANLLLNAAQGAHPDGRPNRIRVQAEADCAWLRLVVEDTGVGMSGEQLAQLAEPRVVRGSEPGQRLGLALARRLVEEMGGTLTVASAEGLGTRVFAELPTAPCEAER